VERRRYRAMDHVIAISQCTRRDLLQVAGIDSHRVDVIYHGVDRETFQPEPEPRERVEITALLGSDRPYLLYVGGFDRRKNVPQMVEAFGRRLSEMDEQLLICGDLEPTERAAIEEHIRQTGSEHRVVLAGFVAANRLPALYRQATAHVMLSSYEGFGMTITEAFACGDVNRFLWLDQRYYLADDILNKCDRMSMAHSLEVRPPFLDHRIVEFAASLPENLKVRGKLLKFILRDLMRGKLPEAVLTRPKEGFDIPAHRWFRGPLRPLLDDVVSERAVHETGVFQWQAVARIKSEHQRRAASHGYGLWGLLILFLWMRRWKIECAAMR